MASLTLTRASIPVHGDAILSASTLRSTPPPKTLRFPSLSAPNSRVRLSSRVRASSNSPPAPNPLAGALRSAVSGALLLAATTAGILSGKLSPARAETASPPAAATEERIESTEASPEAEAKADDPSPLSDLLDSSSDAVAALRSHLHKKLEEGEDSEALEILRRLMATQPAETEWKFLAARLLNEMGEPTEARRLFEEILAADPLSFEALFENAVLMDRCGEGGAVIKRLEQALELARTEQKEKAARDVRLIMAQIQFLQKDVDRALESYEELAKEDPKDYRPLFCQGVIYSLLDRNKEAREKFAKYHELSPKKFDVDAYLQTPLSRMRLFGTGDSE